MSNFQSSDAQSDSSLSAHSPTPSGDCERVAPLLTAWFDGEAGEAEIKIVEEHLHSCRSCAVTRQGWHHTRFLLRSTPLPAPPVGLLTRILQACRIASLSPSSLPFSTRRNSQNASQSTFTTLNLRSAAEAGPDVSHLPLGGFTWDDEWTPLPPSELQDAILRRTTRRTEDLRRADTSTSMIVPHLLGYEGRLSGRKIQWSLWTRQAANFAIPAALFWIVMSPETAQTPRRIQLTPVSSVSSTEKPKGLMARVSEVEPESQGDAPRITRRSEKVAVAKVEKEVEATETEAENEVLQSAAQPATVKTASDVDLQTEAPESERSHAVATTSIQFASLSTSKNIETAPLRQVENKVRLAALPAKVVSPWVGRRGTGHRPKISIGLAKRAIGSPSGAVKAFVASSEMGDRRIGGSIMTPFYRANSSGEVSSLPMPRLATHVENSEPSAESDEVHKALTDAPDWADSRPDDIRNVVDAYAAALIRDDVETESSETNG